MKYSMKFPQDYPDYADWDATAEEGAERRIYQRCSVEKHSLPVDQEVHDDMEEALPNNFPMALTVIRALLPDGI